jgi:hypothetical protein
MVRLLSGAVTVAFGLATFANPSAYVTLAKKGYSRYYYCQVGLIKLTIKLGLVQGGMRCSILSIP